ncbi:MAG: hydrolase [Gammaproteobacteria bacterium]
MARGTDAPGHGRRIERGDFRPHLLLPGPHLPTIWASACRPRPRPAVTFERLELPDGDFLDLAWHGPRAGPLVLLLHGLEGSVESSYVRALLAALDAAGYRGVLMHFRGCSGEMNRLDRSYHSGDTGDLEFVVRHLTEREGRAPVAAVGYSLGGNVLLKWLGELGAAAPLATAVAVSVPFDLAACADRLDQGFSRFYQRRLVSSLKQKFLHKFSGREAPVAVGDVHRLDTFWQFDDAVTAPLHGFSGADAYYRLSSSRQYLSGIRTPTLIVHAEDDPFVPAAAIPDASELAAGVTLEVTAGGGHVGFVGTGGYWLERRILAHLGEFTADSGASG